VANIDNNLRRLEGRNMSLISYTIKWQDALNKGQGETELVDASDLEKQERLYRSKNAWVEQANKEYPHIKHWLEVTYLQCSNEQQLTPF
jgi:hypothetical protein